MSKWLIVIVFINSEACYFAECKYNADDWNRYSIAHFYAE